MTYIDRLNSTVASLAPIHGVGVGSRGDSSTVTIIFKDTATVGQRAAAQNAVTIFDWSDAAQAVWEAAQNPEKDSLGKAATTALAANTTFLGLASPTNPQVLAQVQALTQQNSKIIKRLIQFTG